MTIRTALRSSLAATLAVGWAVAQGAAVQVQVSDGAGQPLAGAVVFLESAAAKAAVRPARGAEIAQADKQFVPAVSVVPVGSAVDFPNRDTVRHHVYSFSPAKPFELKLYTGKPANPVVFDRAGIAVLGCNIHDHMAAWVVVVETPYYTQSSAAGRATLEDVPAGSYRLRVWHTNLPVGAPALDQPITVAATGASAQVRLSGSAP